MRISLLAVLAAAITSLVLAPAASAAKRIPCVLGEKKGPKCLVWTAKVRLGDDGDTVKARIKNGRRYGKPELVRLTGIQAMELFNYSRKGRRGYCMAVPATVALEKMVKRSTVRLVAQQAGSRSVGDARARLRRSIQVKRGGRWIDPAAELLRRGLVLPFPNGQEWAWNGIYSRLAQEAAAKGIGIWSSTTCKKPGPSQSSPLVMKVKWDAEGVDRASGEWIRITNTDPVNPVSLKGWAVRDAHLRGDKKQPGFKFPANAIIPPGGSIKVVVGKGSNTSDTLHWGLPEKETIFENASNDKKQTGDGAYLFDQHGELRSYVMYPCRVSCSSHYAGKIELSARYQGIQHEWVTLTNRSATVLPLHQYELESSPWFYEFGPRDVLEPGRSIVVWIDKPHMVPIRNGSSVMVPPVPGLTPFETVQVGGFKSWNHPQALLGDGADVVALRDPLGMPVPGACAAWGSARCPRI